MAKNEAGMGFRTPTKELQNTFAAMQTELSATKANWAELQALFTQQNTTFLEKIDKVQDKKWMLIMMYSQVLGRLVSRLGVEMTETHERLAKCEKAINELKRMVK